MKKMTKKIVSIVLSALMVVSMLPSFAVTAMAEETKSVGLVAEYFSGSDLSKDYTGNGRTMTLMGNVAWWNNNEDYYKDSHTGAYFSGKDSYATKYDALKNAGITVENGFSISFYGFKYATGNWRRFIDLCNGTDSYTFITTSGMVGIKEPGTGDKTNRSGSETADRTWNKYLLSCDSTGAKVYRDGVLIAQQSYENNTAWLNAMISTADLQVGLSAYSADEKLDGIIRELRIYDTACTPAEIETASVDNYKANRISRGIPEVFNAPAYHDAYVATGGYSNVVWHTANSTDWGTKVSENNAGFKNAGINLATNIVLAYDGKNAACLPTTFEYYTTNNSNRMKTLFPNWNDVDVMEFRDYWHGFYDNDWTAYKYNETGNITGYAAGIDLESDIQSNSNTKRFIYNKLYYKGTGNTDTYYEIIRNLKFDLWAKKGSNGYGDNAFQSNAVIYVLNYKPVYDILATKDYATIFANEAKYTADSFAAFKTAVENVAMLDVNGYFANETGSTVEANVIAAANAIKTTANAYNTAKANLECAHNYVQTAVNDNVYTYTCDAICGDSYTVNKQALVAAIDSAEVEKNQSYYEAKYTDSSKIAFETALDSAKDALVAVNVQSDVETATTELTTKQSKLNKAKYSITVQAVDENGDSLSGGIYFEYETSLSYGDVALVNANIDPIGSGSYAGRDSYIIRKWTKSVNGKDIDLGTNNKFITDAVIGDTVYNCYVLNYDASSNDGMQQQTRVRYIDKSNNTISYEYATIGASVTPNCDHPNVPYYDFTGWQCVYGNPKDVDGTEVVFKATYTYQKSDANKCQIVGLNGVEVAGKTTYDAYYDELVTLTGSVSGYAYADKDGNIISAIAGDQIYAPHNSKTIYVVALTVEESEKASSMITGHIMNPGQVIINAQSYVPSDAVLVETGIVVSKQNANPQIGVDKCVKVAATNVGSKGEFSMSFGFNNTGETTHFRSYVIYRNNADELCTVYSDVYDVILA